MYNGGEINLLDPPIRNGNGTSTALVPLPEEGRKKRRRAPASSPVVSALDLGTTKICVLVGRLDTAGQLQLMGMGQTPSVGLKRGMVADIDQTVASIRAAVDLAEDQAGVRLHDVHVGIAGGHISCMNSTAMIEVANPSRGVTRRERARVLERSKAVAIPEDREIIHVIPQEFICDDQPKVKSPVGMSCQRLQVKVHLVTAAVASAQNIVRCVHRAGLRTADILFESLASSMSILREEEKELGVLLIDIGGGTSDVALFANGAVRFTGVVPFGGNAISNDIAHALCISGMDAELLKRGSGYAMADAVHPSETVEVSSLVSSTPVKASRQFLARVIEARCVEILENALEMVERAGFGDSYTGGVVLTGGTALLEGLKELAENIFDCDVRVGTPREIDGRSSCPASPIYATAQGLLLHGLNREAAERADANQHRFMGRVYQKFIRMIDWYV